MRETGPVAKDFNGDTQAAQEQTGVARVILGQLKNLMALGGIAVGQRTVNLASGARITASSMPGLDHVHVTMPEAPLLESTEVTAAAIPEPIQDEAPPVPPPPQIVPTQVLQLSGLDLSNVGEGAAWGYNYRVNGKVVGPTYGTFTITGDQRAKTRFEVLAVQQGVGFQVMYEGVDADRLNAAMNLTLLPDSTDTIVATCYSYSVLKQGGLLSLFPDLQFGATAVLMETLVAAPSIVSPETKPTQQAISMLFLDQAGGGTVGAAFSPALYDCRTNGANPYTAGTFAPPVGGATSFVTDNGQQLTGFCGNSTTCGTIDQSIASVDGSLTLAGDSDWDLDRQTAVDFILGSASYPTTPFNITQQWEIIAGPEAVGPWTADFTPVSDSTPGGSALVIEGAVVGAAAVITTWEGTSSPSLVGRAFTFYDETSGGPAIPPRRGAAMQWQQATEAKPGGGSWPDINAVYYPPGVYIAARVSAYQPL